MSDILDFIHFICWEDELKWMGRVPRLGFVTSEEELLLGQVSLALLGLSNASYVVFLRTGRSSDGPEFGITHYFWAGPHRGIYIGVGEECETSGFTKQGWLAA